MSALLLWELQQHAARLQPIAEAFRVADSQGRGLLSLATFRRFCAQLNEAMPDEEVCVLYKEELDRQGADRVSFSTICRCLLPAM